MNTLQFIDSMTGRLAWPVAAVILGLVFRKPIRGLLTRIDDLLSRIRKFRIRDAEAELAEAKEAVEEAAKEAAEPLPADAKEGERENHERIERLLREAAEWGFTLARTTDWPVFPKIRIKWEDGQPRLSVLYSKAALLRRSDSLRSDTSLLMDELIRRAVAAARATGKAEAAPAARGGKEPHASQEDD